MDILARGQNYPLMRHDNEGVTANFLTSQLNTLQVILHDMSYKEEVALRRGKMKAGCLYQDGCLLWLFQFYDNKGRPFLSFDAPYDIRIIPKELLKIPHIESDSQCLSIVIHAIDEHNILRGIREVTMPAHLTEYFLLVAQDQMASSQTNNLAMAGWNNKPISELINQTSMYVMGK